MTRAVVPFREAADWEAAATAVAAHLAAGGLVAHPTETVYGIGCALRDDALVRLAHIKRREGRPFLVLVADAGPVAKTEWSDDAARLAVAFWPGPLTLIVRARPAAFPVAVLGPDRTLAVRATSHAGLRRVLRELGAPMTSTSANLPGAQAAARVSDVRLLLDQVDAARSIWLLDGGDLPASPPSTLVDCTVRPPRVRRAGATPVQVLREVIDGIEED